MGILAVYGAPQKNADHANLAVKSTLRMLGALSRINEWSATKGLPEVKIRCGVHTGRVLVGNMGFHSRMKYGVVGQNANVPDRLEELNKTYGTNLLISSSTYSKIPQDAFVIRPIDYIFFEGQRGSRVEPIYQVIAKERTGPVRH